MSSDPLADAALDAVFTALALPVSYMSKLGPTTVVHALRIHPQVVLDGLGGGRQLHDGAIVQIRAAELHEASPGEGDQLLIDDRRYRVRSAHYADSARLIWEIEAVPC